MPVFVKDGTLLPVAEPVQYTDSNTVYKIKLREFGDCAETEIILVDSTDDKEFTEYKVKKDTKGNIGKRYVIL